MALRRFILAGSSPALKSMSSYAQWGGAGSVAAILHLRHSMISKPPTVQIVRSRVDPQSLHECRPDIFSAPFIGSKVHIPEWIGDPGYACPPIDEGKAQSGQRAGAWTMLRSAQ